MDNTIGKERLLSNQTKYNGRLTTQLLRLHSIHRHVIVIDILLPLFMKYDNHTSRNQKNNRNAHRQRYFACGTGGPEEVRVALAGPVVFDAPAARGVRKIACTRSTTLTEAVEVAFIAQRAVIPRLTGALVNIGIVRAPQAHALRVAGAQWRRTALWVSVRRDAETQTTAAIVEKSVEGRSPHHR